MRSSEYHSHSSYICINTAKSMTPPYSVRYNGGVIYVTRRLFNSNSLPLAPSLSPSSFKLDFGSFHGSTGHGY